MNTMQVIRSIQHGDMPIIADWMAATPLWQRYNLGRDHILTLLSTAVDDDTNRLIVADHSPERGRIHTAVGFAWVILRGAFGRNAYLKLIGVHPEFTGHHIGGVLLDAVEQIARDNDQDLFLMTSDFNTDAHRFYERQGYRQVGAIPGYALPEVTELIFWKPLSDPEA
jgi:ribosomal protein S18 acetylase RimI-like enzyme